MAVGSNVVSIVVQAVDKSTTPLKEIQEQLTALKTKAAALHDQLAASAEQSGRAQVRAAESVQEANVSLRTKLLSMSSALAGAAAVGSLLSRSNEQLSQTLGNVSIAVSAAGTTLHAVAQAIRAAAALTGGWVVALAAVGVAAFVLVKHWDEAIATAKRLWASFGQFLGKLWDAIVVTGRGVGDVLQGIFTFKFDKINEGIATFRYGLSRIRDIAVDVGGQAFTLLQTGWKIVTDFFAGPATKKAVESVNAVREAVVLLGAEMSAFMVTLQATNSAWKAEAAAALAAQRAGERGAEFITQLRVGYEKLREQALPVVRDLAAELAKAASAMKAWRDAMIRPMGQQSLFGELNANNLAAQQAAIQKSTDALAAWRAQMIQPMGRSLFAELADQANAGQRAAQAALLEIRNRWVQSFAEMAVGLRSFGDFVGQIWNDILAGIASKIAQIVGKWLDAHSIMSQFSLSNIFSGIPILGPITRLLHGIIPFFAEGGVVSRPTLAMVGESGPELITPLSKMGGFMGGGGGVTVYVQAVTLDQFQGWELGKVVAEEVRKQERRRAALTRTGDALGISPVKLLQGGGLRGNTGFNSLRR